jgi:thioredoxin-related protein
MILHHYFCGMIRKGSLHIVIGIALLSFATSKISAQNKVRWMSMEEALKKSEVKPRKIFIDVYTEWCKWCKKMEETTFSEDKIAKYINEHYYAVKLDAEYKEKIVFDGQTYEYQKSYPRGYHELAYELLEGKLKLPSIIIIDENLKVKQSIDGFKNCLDMDMIIKYYGSDSYKTISWRAYTKTFQEGIPAGGPDKE